MLINLLAVENFDTNEFNMPNYRVTLTAKFLRRKITIAAAAARVRNSRVTFSG